MSSLFAFGLCIGVLCQDEQFPDSADRVREVLSAEARNSDEFDDRAAVLNPLDAGASDEAKWHSGYIKVGDEWVDYSNAVDSVAADKLQSEYRARRAEAKTGRQLLNLAMWCKRNGLNTHVRVHKTQALELEPKLFKVRRARDVGLVNVNGYWLTPAKAENARREMAFTKESLKRYKRKCQSISQKLSGSGARVREGLERLSEITKSDAVPAIDKYIGQRGRNGSRHAVNAFGQIPTVRSTIVLAKYAVYANSATVRSDATDELSKRRLSDFVPLLLKLLSTEIQKVEERSSSSSPFSFFTTPRDYTFRSTYLRETQDSIATVGSTVRIDPNAFYLEAVEGNGIFGSFDRLSVSEAREAAERTTAQAFEARWGVSIEEANEGIRKLNERVDYVLCGVSDRSGSENPAYWWDWWTDQSGTDPIQKQVIEVQEIESSSITRVVVPASSSCFAAGTMVRTDRGLRKIETIEAGDRVLSQSVRTGELDFKVVERPTVRAQPGPVIQVQLGMERLICTPGHEIWQNGVGWVRAKDLRRGDRVRTLRGSVEVGSIVRASPRLTYNLVVEASHTYFVGESACLVHDVTTSVPTDNVAPGLSRFAID